MNFKFEPFLENDYIKLIALKPDDFDVLYKIASDKLVWEQHPNKNRYERNVFETFFKGAIESKQAYLVYNIMNNEVIGSSRYYEYDEDKSTIAIGYTFIARQYWGLGLNKQLKTLMLNYAFKYLEHVHFHIGSNNIRSQKAIEKIGAIKIGEINMEYYGEELKLNFIYQITKNEWAKSITNF